ncbi:MAG: ChbG/HpnK family deacetylase [Anaerolineae bacterium]|nr:ChbG/HpnK family deacetylase [Phycisphaerae bacterium]
MNTVLVNADDFGLHPDIDRGILECVDAGVVQSISFSPQGQTLNWSQLADLRARGIRCGLHVTLVGEPWLTDGRIVAGWKDLVKQLASPTASGRAMKLAVEREVNAQVAMCQQNRIAISHIDSHQYVHAFPGVWQPVLNAAQRLGSPRIRVPKCPSPANIKKNIGGMALQWLAARLGNRVGRFLPILGLAHAGHNTLEIYTREFRAVSGVDIELCVHPGVNTPSLEQKYADWKFDWTGERDALLDPQFAEMLKQRGYQFAPLLPSLNETAVA